MASEQEIKLSIIAKGVLDASERHGLFERDSLLLLMVSGGSDSTALACVMYELREAGLIGGQRLAVLHVNHGLRGADSDGDASFVNRLAHRLGISFFLHSVDVAEIARASGENVEAAGRQERYRMADSLLSELCADRGMPVDSGRIVVAHTADDRIENFYMRSIVGTGPGGFRGMAYRNRNVVRPLLGCFRTELREYIGDCAARGFPVVRDASGSLWREDSTNGSTDRFRAYVRANIVPWAREWNARAPKSLLRSMDLIAEEDDMLDAMTDAIIADCVDGKQYPRDSVCHEDGGSDGRLARFRLLPKFASVQRPLQRRAVHKLLKRMFPEDTRVDLQAVDAVLAAFDPHGNKPIRGGYTANIQGNLAVSANKAGVLVEHMAEYRARRKPNRKTPVSELLCFDETKVPRGFRKCATQPSLHPSAPSS